jgi:DNA-binding MarR family transcriptional regulator
MLASKQVDWIELKPQDQIAPHRGTAPGKAPELSGPALRGKIQDPVAGPELSAARLRIAVARLSRRLRPTEAAGALTVSEVDVLVAAERRGPIRLSDLASFAGLNPTMLSRLIPKLEQAGLIRRLADGADRRVCRVEATAKGRALLDRVRSERNDALSRRLLELDANQREAVVVALPVLEELAERLIAPEQVPINGGGR